MSGDLRLAPIGSKRGAWPGRSDWHAIMPVPQSAPPPFPSQPPRRGKPSARYRYDTADRRLIGYVCRFDVGGGEKEFRALTYGRCGSASTPEWRYEGWQSLLAYFHEEQTLVSGERAA